MASITNENLLELLTAEFGGKILNSEENYGLLNIEISREDVPEIIGWLKNHETLKFGYLTDLCAVHYPEILNRELALVYHLHSLENNLRLRLKAFFPIADATAPTLTGLFAGANWMERETFDFYGVVFTGHPDLRRILNMDEMDYFPLRKEYALEDETRTDKKDKYFGR
jgi:NADH-quinone oxidoreductase subunit C